MELSPPRTNGQRIQFVGYLAAAAAALLLLQRVATYFRFGETGTETWTSMGWLDRVSYLSSYNQHLGLLLVAAAFLLTLDRDDEPRLMTVPIVAITVMSFALMMLSVIGTAGIALDNDQAVYAETTVGAILDRISSFALGLTALGLTWNVIVNPSAEDDELDVDAPAEQGE